MLATGHSAIAAVHRVKDTHPRSVKFMCLIAAKAGVQAFHEEHPDVDIYTPAVEPVQYFARGVVREKGTQKGIPDAIIVVRKEPGSLSANVYFYENTHIIGKFFV